MTRTKKKEILMYTAYQVILIIRDAEECRKKGYSYETQKKDIVFTKTILEELIEEHETHEKKQMWENTLKEINKFLEKEEIASLIV